MRRLARLALAAAISTCGLLFAAHPALAQSVSIDLGSGGPTVTGRIVQLLALITVISLAPSILVMVTSFTRIVVVLAFVRTALGTPQTPPNQVLVGLALFLTMFVMMPTFEKSWDAGIQPLLAGRIDEMQAIERAAAPLGDFMLEHVREQDVALFIDLAGLPAPAAGSDVRPPYRVLIPAFMICGIAARLRDRLPRLRAVPDHRHGGGDGLDVDGHDDAAAGRRRPPLQDHLLRPRRRLVSDRRQPRPQLRRLTTISIFIYLPPLAAYRRRSRVQPRGGGSLGCLDASRRARKKE